MGHHLSGMVMCLLALCMPGPSSSAAVDKLATEPPSRLAPVELIGRTELPPNVALEDYLVSEKYDGVRGRWDGKAMWSKQGKPIALPAWFVTDLPAQPLEGELWLGRGQFEAVAGLIRGRLDNPLWQQLRFMVFDTPMENRPFAERYLWLLALGDKGVRRIAPQLSIGSVAGLQRLFDERVAAGAEGLVLHHKQALYQEGRNTALIKLKPLLDAEATVIGYRPGKGEFSGILGSLKLRTAQGLEFYLSAGLTLEQRRHPPPLGTVISFQYRGLSAKGVPKGARFWRVRPPQS
ncbi:DNA ligase [Shewanella sedimentimangrovi]|uniref:DNA ligase n=1 Tax=Shewanella sedimentimangrovi TaxID=2814293 RepID=A0ABX7R615_9GAMM|nr:DNA ligase [Shewanella sedimentimangrovi]QSX38692.1 DNA ligase [Shewanella sedimentimangrovi]